MASAILMGSRPSPSTRLDAVPSVASTATRRTCAIIPARNEATTIAQVVAGVRQTGIPVVVVDDHSQDDTNGLATKAGAVTVRNDLSEHGYSAAVLKGLALARQWGTESFLTIDADGAHDPNDVEGLLDFHHSKGASLTIGDRFTHLRSDVPSTKRWANYFASSLLNMAIGTHFADVACGIRAYSKEVVDVLLANGSAGGYALPYEAILLTHRHDSKIASYSVSVRYDASALLCTRTPELLDFLGCIIRISPNKGKLHSALSRLFSFVSALEPFSLTIDGAVLCAHPIGETGYLFERQDEAFKHRRVGPTLAFGE